MLDSGEADTMRYDTILYGDDKRWGLNTGLLAMEGGL